MTSRSELHSRASQSDDDALASPDTEPAPAVPVGATRRRAGGVRIPDGYGPPVVIGGLGGSGTRVAARLLLELGFNLGEDLNGALDNLSYTLLFKRPRWFGRAAARQRRVDAAARPLVRSLTVGATPGARELLTVIGAMLAMMPRGHDHLGSGRGVRWAPRRVGRLLASRGHEPLRATGWGWKEPNSHLLLAELDTALPGLRFIHVLRDVEQIARGKNQRQMHNWSRHVGLEPPRAGADLVEYSLEFCRVATDRTADIGRSRLGARYHQLDINRLCAEPDPELDALLGFLGLAPDADTRERLRAIPDAARLAGRL
jgi:hypothetical protein